MLMTPALVVTNLSKTFPKSDVVAVKDLSFSLQKGEILGLLGPNGAGKTTTIKMLISILTPSAGQISYFGKDLDTHRSEILTKVGYASTYTNLPLYLSVWENLEIHGLLYGMNKQVRVDRINSLLDQLDISELAERRVSQLSAGQKTLVMLIKAFLPNPEVVLLDEPTASLDPDVSVKIREFVALQRKENNSAILYTSHNMREVSLLCDRVLFLKNGAAIAFAVSGLHHDARRLFRGS